MKSELQTLEPPATIESEASRGLLSRAGSMFLWYLVPTVAVAAVAAYIGTAIAWHVNPPVVPVAGGSMRPTLQPGDLVVLRGVDPKALRKGDIVAVHVPKDAQSTYSLPGNVVHRIVKIGRDANGLVFTTKGDANSGADVFQTPASQVIGKEVLAVPGLGYPLLFFRSHQGKIFLIAVIVIAILYFAIGVVEERRAYTEGTAVTIGTVLEETQELKQVIVEAQRFAALARTRSALPAGIDSLAAEVRSSREHSEESSATVRELVGAIGEYGEHLRSHTSVMQSLAATALDLQRATEELRSTVGAAPARPAIAEPATPSPGHGRPLLLEQPAVVDPSPGAFAPVVQQQANIDRIVEEITNQAGHGRRLPLEFPTFVDPELGAFAPVALQRAHVARLLEQITERTERESRARAELRRKLDP